MTEKLADIPKWELIKDLRDSIDDLVYAEKAIVLGLMTTRSGQVQNRIDGNRHFINVIISELDRRINDNPA